jgi:dTDP-4-amino-4,6-dideoxygalactose transaminase
MTDIQASIGTTQMDRAESIHKKRSDIALKYDKVIDKISWLQKPHRNKNHEHGFQAYVCLFRPEEITLKNSEKINAMRNKFMEYLQNNGISTRPGTHAVHMLEFYKKKYNLKKEDYPKALAANDCSIAFPIFPSISSGELDYILEKIYNYKI